MANRPTAPALPQRPRLLVPILVVLALLVVLLALAVGLYTDLLWFREVDFTTVFTTVLGTRVLLFVLFGAAMATIVGANITIAYRIRPGFRPLSLEQQNLERYRLAVEPHLLPLLLGASSVVGVFAGLSAASRWETWLLWRNATPFGVDDPQFGMDISFFAFDYPFYRFVLGFLFTALVLSLLAALATHYLFGGLRLQTPGERIVAAARAHVSVLAGLFVLLKAVAYFLDRYGLAFSETGFVSGLSYTDVNAVLPAKSILVGIAAICALLFFANIRFRNFALPLTSLGVLVFAAVAIGGLYPAAIQQFRVQPNEAALEAPYIERNIAATRAAYDIDDVVTEQYDGSRVAETEDIRSDTGTIPNARLLDPTLLSPTYRQLEQIRNYFGFADTLDIDRYDLGDGRKDYVVGVRELDQDNLRPDQRNWINERLIYTHGNGFVAAPANTVDNNGRPLFAVNNVPPVVREGLELPIEESRIYYGELSPEYSVVNTEEAEVDGPAAPGSEEEATSSYAGEGGIELSNLFRKTLYALKYRERNLLLSGALTSDSRIMYDRDPRTRVEKVAPFLELDGDPYPAVVDGRIQWILDGYTTTSAYPYSQPRVLQDVTADADTLSAVGNRTLLPQEEVNYIRNSVKATVDAYTGEVVLYAFDEADPVLRTWQKAFDGVVRPASEISDELRAHFRYPEDLFKVQRDLYAQYHVTDARVFFSQEDFWRIPADPTTESADAQGRAQPPYYQFLQPPGTDEPQFALTSQFVAQSRPNLTAFAAVSSQPEDYGTMRVYELPANAQVDGPGTVQGAFRSNQEVAQLLTLLDQQGSRVRLGNLLTLPVGGGLLYVQPVYTQASGGEAFPLLRRVLLAFGDQIAFTDTLEQGLDQVFGPGAAPPGVESPADPTAPGVTPPAPEDGAPVPAPTPDTGSLAAAVAAAQQAQDDAAAALAAGDFAAYGEAQERLGAAIDQAAAALAASNAAPTPAPSPSAPAPAPSAPAPASLTPGTAGAASRQE